MPTKEDEAPKGPIRSGSATTPTSDQPTGRCRVYVQETHADLGLLDDDGQAVGS